MQLTLELLNSEHVDGCVERIMAVEKSRVSDTVFEEVEGLPIEAAIRKAEDLVN